MKVRVEIGPKDVAKGECVLAIMTTPGELAQKQTLKVHAATIGAIVPLHPCCLMRCLVPGGLTSSAHINVARQTRCTSRTLLPCVMPRSWRAD